MSQVFSGDSVNGTPGLTVVGATETPIVTGNFVNPPFGNAKAIVIAMVTISTGTGTVFVQLRVRRNPNAENVLLAAPALSIAAPNGGIMTASFADQIPDGRPVQYQVTVQQNGATANGTSNYSNVTTLLISG